MAMTMADWRRGYTVRPTRHCTDDVRLFYVCVEPGTWQFLLADEDRVAQVGPFYASERELLADADRFAHEYGFPTGRPAQDPADTTVYWLGIGHTAWPDPLRLHTEDRAARWLREYGHLPGVRVVKVTETREPWTLAPATEETPACP